MTRPVAPLVVALAALSVAARVHAEPIPPPIAAMIDEAYAEDAAKLDVVASIAKKTHPQSAAEIDARVAFLRDDAEKSRIARLSSLNFREGWKGQGEAGGSISTGNTDETALTLALNLNKETVLRRDRIIATVDDRSSNGAKTANRDFASYQSDFKFDDKLYANLLASWERDPFAGLDSRFSESAGVGYRVLAAYHMTLDAELGLAARQTRYTATGDETTVGVRTSVRYEWKLRPETTLTEAATAYVDNRSDTVESATEITTKIIGALSWRGAFNVRYESNPPALQNTTDTTTRFSLVYSF